MRRLHWFKTARMLITDALDVYWKLLKIMVPALIVVKILQEWGAVDWLGSLLGPAMAIVGLPALLGVVWATTLLTNMFTGLVLFFEVSASMSLTVEQVTVLGVLMLIGHSIPVEGAVAKRAGVPWSVTIALRVVGALVLGAILHWLYSTFNIYQSPANITLQMNVSDDSIVSWLYSQLNALVIIFFIIFALIVFLKVLRVLGLERLIHFVLTPILRALGIGKAAANVTVIGVALGLSYGAGLLIQDLDKGVMSKRDAYLALCLLSLLHSLIEDTLLIMTMGAELSGILWARLIFSIIVIFLMSRFMKISDVKAKVRE